jgi:CubicO group peptidase (beta-lactamase class C family)
MKSGNAHYFRNCSFRLIAGKERVRIVSSGFFVFYLLLLFSGCQPNTNDVLLAPFHKINFSQVDMALKSMSDEQKIAQLIMVRASGEAELEQLLEDASRGMLGGVILRDITADTHLEFVKNLRKASAFPLLIGTEETGVLNNQFCDATPFPARISLDALKDMPERKQIQALLHAQTLALQINLGLEAPLYRSAVWDDSTSLPKSTFRPDYEALKSLERDGIIRLGNSLSHWVQIPGDTSGLTKKILRPYRQLAEAGISGFWIDNAILQADQPRNYLRNYMNNTLAFDGLLVGSGDMDALFFAGADLIISSSSASEARQKAMQLLTDRSITPTELNRRVRRVLTARIWSENNFPKSRPNPDIASLLNNSDLQFQATQLWENAAVVLQNPGNIIPLEPEAYQIWNLSGNHIKNFIARSSKYGRLDTLYRRGSAPQINNKPLVVVWESASFPISSDSAFHDALRQYSSSVPVALIHFGDVRRLERSDTSIAIVQLWEYNVHTENAAANILFGAQASGANLPEAVGARFKYGEGLELPKVRLRYSAPEAVGIATSRLSVLDTLVQKAINDHLFPGCQIFVAHQGHVVYAKSFGQLHFANDAPVTDTSLYDIASLTKIAATTMLAMYLKDKEKIRLENTVQAFIPTARGKNGKITIGQLLNHTSGLPPSLPISTFLNNPLPRRRSCNAFFCNRQQPGYTVQVAENLYFKDAARRSLLSALHQMPIKGSAVRYGDVNMVILQQILERAGGATLDKLADSAFFHPLGLTHITFNPLKNFASSAIAPTENDTRWRQQLVHGFVHDQAAALLGGVAGHAGLFSNAENLGLLFQMLLNEGEYGGRLYLQPETVSLFTGHHARSNRGLGFDKPRKMKNPSFGNRTSSTAFGHGGFTGSCAWADPEKQLVFVFLSNRVHPNVKNPAFFESRIRQKLHDVVYTALGTYEPGWGM